MLENECDYKSLLVELISKIISKHKLKILRFVGCADGLCKGVSIADGLGMSTPLLSFHLSGNKNKCMGLVSLGLIEKCFDGRNSLIGFRITFLGRLVLAKFDNNIGGDVL